MKAFLQRWYQHYQDDKTARQNALLCQESGISPEQLPSVFNNIDEGLKAKERLKSFFNSVGDALEEAEEYDEYYRNERR